MIGRGHLFHAGVEDLGNGGAQALRKLKVVFCKECEYAPKFVIEEPVRNFVFVSARMSKGGQYGEQTQNS